MLIKPIGKHITIIEERYQAFVSSIWKSVGVLVVGKMVNVYLIPFGFWNVFGEYINLQQIKHMLSKRLKRSRLNFPCTAALFNRNSVLYYQV